MSNQKDPGQASVNTMPSELALSDNASLRMINEGNITDFTPEIIRHINGDLDIRASYHTIPFIASRELVRDGFVSNPADGRYEYAITADDRFVGLIGLMKRDNSNLGNEVSIGYSLDESHRRRGLVSSGIELLMDRATKVLRPDYFTLYISDQNPRSQAVAARKGFIRTESMFETESGKIERRYVRPGK